MTGAKFPSANDGVLTYGIASNLSVKLATSNFVGASINGPSMCCTPIELLSNDGEDSVVATASGFFWLYDNKPYLVTNWHVVSGRSPFTGKLRPNGFIPKKIRFFGRTFQLNNGLVKFTQPSVTIELSDELADSLTTPPQVHGTSVDIWATPVSSETVFGRDPERNGFSGAAAMSCFINERINKKIVTRSGDDCFILGYPLRNYAGLYLPVWKRGSIASETSIGVGNYPVFLVDAATMPSMSGSPIIRRVNTVTALNTELDALEEQTAFDLIGVYAGRLESKDMLTTNLGYAWYKTLIDDVIRYYGISHTESEPLAGS